MTEGEPAVLKAMYADWKLIKTRSQVQLVFEIPQELADEAFTVLGGMPSQAKSVWVAIARLTSPPAEQPPTRERRLFNQLPFPQQAGIRCNEPEFWAYLREIKKMTADNEDSATACVYEICKIQSRSDLAYAVDARKLWIDLEAGFQARKLEDRIR